MGEDGFVLMVALWWWSWRWCQSVVTSVTAARADGSSTMLRLVAYAAMSDWTARLFTARGSPRLTWWMSSVASSD